MSGISAQVSVYPLGQTNLKSAITQVLEIFRQHELDVTPGSMSTIISGEPESVFAAVQAAFRITASHGETVMVVTFSNACPKAVDDPEGNAAAFGDKNQAVTYHPIGIVKNAFDDSSHWEQMRASNSQIILDPKLVIGLQGLEPGQKVMVLFYFDRVDEFELLQHPRGDPDRQKKGVFTIRSPRRPNPIGVTVVDLLSIDRNLLTVRGLDAFDGTPILDLKPA
jgi:L-fuculose-phosphate aldolase